MRKQLFGALLLMAAATSAQAVTKVSGDYCDCGPYGGVGSGLPWFYGNLFLGKGLDEADRTWGIQLDVDSFYQDFSTNGPFDLHISGEIKYTFDVPQAIIPKIFALAGPSYDRAQNNFGLMTGLGLEWFPFLRDQFFIFIETKRTFLFPNEPVEGDWPVLLGVGDGL